MKNSQKYIAFLILLFSFTLTVKRVYSTETPNALSKATTVWICFTKNSYAYHYNYNCQGLKRCKGEKRKVTLEAAINKYERKLCGYEK